MDSPPQFFKGMTCHQWKEWRGVAKKRKVSIYTSCVADRGTLLIDAHTSSTGMLRGTDLRHAMKIGSIDTRMRVKNHFPQTAVAFDLKGLVQVEGSIQEAIGLSLD